MAVIRCKMCGGDLKLIEGASTAECEFCGSVQTVPRADDEKKLTLFGRANRLRAACEFDKAAGIYESIVADFQEEAEAYWGLVLCKYGIEYVDDPASGKKVPTCHRSSFDSIMEDSDFEQVLENADSVARKVYREEAKTIEEIRKGIVAVSNNEEPYDIFICYKETAEDGGRTLDSVLAQDVYDALSERGYRVFFSRITLEDKLGVEYEPYIFAALNSAKIMLAFGTDYEYFNAVWVKNEWSRFLKLMAQDKSKHLIPCYKGIDAYDMPKEFMKLQAQDLGKVGAVQDLLRGIEKIIPRKQVQPAAAPQPAAAVSPVEAYLKRAEMALEDGEWGSAGTFCEQALNIDPENAQAYLIKLLAEMHVTKPEHLGNVMSFTADNLNYKKLLRFASPALKQTLSQCLAKIEAAARDKQAAADRKASEADFKANATIVGGVLKEYRGKLKNVYIPYGVTAIGDEVFRNKEMVSVTIPDSVKSIGAEAFRWCRALTAVTIPGSVESIGEDAFSWCRVLTTVIISDGVSSIGKSAFANCDALTEVTIPGSVESIGEDAFRGCSALTAVAIDGATSIGDGAFRWCRALTEVTISDGVSSIGKSAFDGCEVLTTVTIPDSVKNIGEEAFSWCKALTMVTIGNGVVNIGKDAFSGCEELTTITIPAGTTQIDSNPFTFCPSLTDIVVEEGNGSFCVMGGHLVNCKTQSLVVGCGDTPIPGNVIRIGESAFQGCETITGATIPDGVMSIGEYAFYECDDLAEVSIPASVTEIQGNPFVCCGSLTKLVVSETNPTFYVRDGRLINRETKTLVTGRGNAPIPDDGSVTAIGESAFDSCEALNDLIIPEGVTRIGDYAFSDCRALASVTNPDSVESIGESAFSECEALVEVSIPGSVESIGESAFSYCKGMTAVTIGDSVKHIGLAAFNCCEALTEVSIPGSVESIGEYAFSECKALSAVTIGDGVTSIGKMAFSDCKALTTLAIPASVKSIGNYAVPDNATILTPKGSFAWNWAKENYRNVREDEQARQAQLAAEAARKAAEAQAEAARKAAVAQAEADRKAKAERQANERRAQFRASGRCQHCGGELKGFFGKKCVSCGKPKDY